MTRLGFLVLCTIALAISAVSAYQDNDPDVCIQKIIREDCPTNPAPFQPINELNVLDVYYLQAPIFEGVYGDLFGELGGYHAAIGFYDITSGLNYTAEYDAFFEVANGTFPNIIENNGTKDILWCNKGILCSFPAINNTYWDPKFFSSASKTYMTTINGTVFNNFNQWMVGYNDTNPNYQTFDLWNNFGESLFIQSNTCDDFAVAGFDYLASQGAFFDCDIVFKRDYINLYTEKPIPVDYETEKDHIIKYYSAFNIHKGESILEIIENLFSIVGLKKYVYIQGNYYQLNMNFPFVDIRYEYAPLPGCPAPFSQDKVIHMGLKR
eukprot:gene10878-12674_t